MLLMYVKFRAFFGGRRAKEGKLTEGTRWQPLSGQVTQTMELFNFWRECRFVRVRLEAILEEDSTTFPPISCALLWNSARQLQSNWR
jgi:hypothetical protein